MSWSTEVFIGEMRPWPDTVHVIRGKTDEMRRYVPEGARDEVYNAGFDNGVQAVFQQLEGKITSHHGLADVTELEEWIDEQWKEYES